MGEKRCTGCQAVVDRDALFCNECGTVQPVITAAADNTASVAAGQCPRCSKILVENAKFCPGCAFDLTAVAAAESAVETVCPNCQLAYGPDDKFCRNCAFDLRTVVKASSAHFCTSCGKPFVPTDKFCRHCAAAISQSDHTVAVPVVSPAAVSRPHIVVPPDPPPPSPQPIFAPHVQVAEPAATGQNPSGPHWISPSAAAFVVICFFLPWMEWSCMGMNRTVSGADIAQGDGSLWLFPIAGIVTIATYFIFKSQNMLWKARPYILISSAVGLLFLIYKASAMTSSTEIFGQRISASDLGLKPHIGGFGTVIGFVGALIGCAFLGRSMASPPGSQPSGWSTGDFNAEGANWFDTKVGSLPANKAAMLAYLSPILLPLIVYLLVFFGGGWIGGILVLLLMLLTPIVTQVVLLKRAPHKDNTFVRFHAWQSLLWIAAYWGVGIFLAGALYVTAQQQGPFSGPSAVAQLLILLMYALGIGNIVLLIFLAVQAHKKALYKLPYLGDRAMEYSERNRGGSNPSIL